MKKSIAFLLAAATILTGCGTKSVSKNESGVSSGGTGSDKPAEDIVLTIAYSTKPNEAMQELIDRFNADDNGVRVEVKSYCNEQAFTSDIQQQVDFDVTQELINKDTIDLVGTFSFGNAAKFEIFKRKGGFVDLYKFMEDDPEVNRDTLNSHILGLCERDGKLYSIPTYYCAKTMISKSEYGGTTPNWTIDEFIEHWDNMPEGSTVNWSTVSEGIYYDVLRANTPYFVDYKKCEVHFDDPDFRKMLEFCGTFESNMGEKRDDQTVHGNPQLVKQFMLTDYGKAIVEEHDYALNAVAFPHLNDGSYTLVGYPTSGRDGAFLCGMEECAIRANISEEKQQAAWKFLREFYREDYQFEHYARNNGSPDGDIVQFEFKGFPINNAARKRVAEGTINGDYLSTESQTANGREMTLIGKREYDQADIDFIDEYMDSIDRWECSAIDSELFKIIEEEVGAYLHGEQDADATVDHIQSRATIWISEQA